MCLKCTNYYLSIFLTVTYSWSSCYSLKETKQTRRKKKDYMKKTCFLSVWPHTVWFSCLRVPAFLCNYFLSQLGLLPRPHGTLQSLASCLTLQLQVSHWCQRNEAWANCLPAVMYAFDYAGKLWGIRIKYILYWYVCPLHSKTDIGHFVLTFLTTLYKHSGYVMIYIIHSRDKKSCATD